MRFFLHLLSSLFLSSLACSSLVLVLVLVATAFTSRNLSSPLPRTSNLVPSFLPTSRTFFLVLPRIFSLTSSNLRPRTSNLSNEQPQKRASARSSIFLLANTFSRHLHLVSSDRIVSMFFFAPLSWNRFLPSLPSSIDVVASIRFDLAFLV